MSTRTDRRLTAASPRNGASTHQAPQSFFVGRRPLRCLSNRHGMKFTLVADKYANPLRHEYSSRGTARQWLFRRAKVTHCDIGESFRLRGNTSGAGGQS